MFLSFFYRIIPRRVISLFFGLLFFICIISENAYAAEYNFTIFDDGGFSWEVTYPVPDFQDFYNGGTSGFSDNHPGGSSPDYYDGSSKTSDEIIRAVLKICKHYDMRYDVTGVRNQLSYLSSLNSAATQAFARGLGIGDALLISLLNHQDINSSHFSTYFSVGDLNRVIAGRICDGAKGYAKISDIADATGLSVSEVKDILDKISRGTITQKTIDQGKNSSQATNRGPLLRSRALKQEKVYTCLLDEVERMTKTETSLYTLYDDLGEGYVKDMIAGQALNHYKVLLYKEHLAKVLDVDEPFTIYDYDVTGSDVYKTGKKVQSVLSGIFKDELSDDFEALPDAMKDFLKEHLKNDILSEEEAREYLILSGEFEAGEHGIGEASRLLAKGWTHMKKLNDALEASGKVFDALDKAKKADEFLEYWFRDYAAQELKLDTLVDSLSVNGANTELMVAAKELKKEYEDKLYGSYSKVYAELIDHGIGTAKSFFPPLKLTEACISLAATLTGTDDYVDAVETGLAMQGICRDSIKAYEDAVIAINNGDESEEAVNRVLTSFSLAKQSLCDFYEAMVEIADTSEEKNLYKKELVKLEKLQFGYISNTPFPGGGGGGGSR